MGLWLAGLGTILGAVNFITTIICMRAPGMTMFRMPIFVWNTLVTSLLVLIAFPILAAALLSLEADRMLGAHVFDASHGGPILWQHLFWFFGHPEVYIIALPFFGIITEILPVFSRKPIFGYVGLVAATLGIAMLSVAVWAHHMFVTGAVNLAVLLRHDLPDRRTDRGEVLQLDRHDVGRVDLLRHAHAVGVGFLTTFLFGGLTGVILASPPLDFHVSDSYFVVAHFHYVVFGTVVFAMFAGFYFWWPKMTGRMLDERLGKIHFWLLFVGFHTTFLVQHWLGVEGMPRRYADYSAERRLHHAQPGLHRRGVPAGVLDAAVPLQRLQDQPHAAGHGRRPVGLGSLPGVGHELPAATAQLRHASRGSAPSRRPSTCTTRRSPRWSTPTTRSRRRIRRRTRDGRPRRRHRRGGRRTDEERDLDLRDLHASSSCWSRRPTGSSPATTPAPPRW